MINAFLDANILLGLHGLTPAEVGELSKIPALVEAGELVLWLPEIVIDEYRRNRPKVVAEALKVLRDSRVSVSTPALSTGLDEQRALQEAVRAAQRAHSELIGALEASAADCELPADRAVDLLIACAQSPATEPVIAAARQRRELRRPPGKADSLGDAISWEALLENVPCREDLHLVSSDSDFRSPLNSKIINEYLENEWASVKQSEVVLYTDLGNFLAKHFAAVAVPSDIPKVRLIQRLATSGGFEVTHEIIAQLGKYDVFTPEQAALIARHAVRNNQVRWIAADDDVREFLARIIDTHRSAIEPGYIEILERCMSGEQPAYSTIVLDGEKL